VRDATAAGGPSPIFTVVTEELQPGATLSHYHVQARIGRGGMGTVYRARDTRLGRDVAIKVINAEIASEADRIARFRREATTLAALNHPGIVAIHDTGHEDGHSYLVTDSRRDLRLAQVHDAVGFGVGKRPQQDAVDDAEDRGIGMDGGTSALVTSARIGP
jgi:serine/threonine protein kinase